MKKIKRILILFLSLLMLLFTTNVFAVRHTNRDIPLNGIIVNDHIVYSDVYPYIKNSRTYVPIRFIAEELGYDVKWDGNNKQVTMTKDSTTVSLKIGSNQMIVNGKSKYLDAPAEIKDDRTFIPLRAVAEAFNEKVDYSSDYKAIYIGNNPTYNKFYKVVYYYEGAKPVISDYTINIVTYQINNGRSITRMGNIHDLIILVIGDFQEYRTTGKSTISSISSYTPSRSTSSSSNETIRIDSLEDFTNNDTTAFPNYTYNKKTTVPQNYDENKYYILVDENGNRISSEEYYKKYYNKYNNYVDYLKTKDTDALDAYNVQPKTDPNEGRPGYHYEKGLGARGSGGRWVKD